MKKPDYTNRYEPPEVVRNLILRALVAHPKMLVREVMGVTGLSRTAIRNHLLNMLEDGIVSKTDTYPERFYPASSTEHKFHFISDEPKKSYPAQTSKSRPRGCTILESSI